MARPENYVTRADLGWGATAASRANLTRGLVIHYDSSNLGLANKPHSACIAYWKSTRSFHMGPSRGWADIGYSFMACPHDYILEGRGIDRQQAAQPGGNATHYSVTLATGPAENIPAAQINAVRRLRKWLMEDHGNAGSVFGHRDFIATSCPGNKAYELVEDGTFAQAPGAVIGGGLGDDMIGLKEGDSGEPVIALQRIISFSGFGSLLGDAGVDGDWGPKTSEALLALRRSVGSKVSDASSITGTAYAHLEQALARAEARKIMEAEIAAAVAKAVEGLPTAPGGTLPATETVTVSGTLEVKR